MSGHSKWSTIKRKKGVNDAKRGKLFAKLIRAIEVAGKQGGIDPELNASLNQAIQKAKSNSVPNQNIENALKRLSGDEELINIQEIYYEGYGPFGIAFYVYCLTDNKNRTSSDVKSTFSRNNGSIGNPGSVSYLFERKGVFELSGDKEKIIDFAIHNNCLDITEQYENIVLEVSAKEFISIKEKIIFNNFEIIGSDLTFLPNINVVINSDKFIKVSKLLEALEDLDDVQEVYTNFDIEDNELETILK
jgi:YebC/PmpR family DNA-binding regulatory protein